MIKVRWPSVRKPLDCLFALACVVLTAFVIVPEIGSVHGKTKDYPLWYWVGQQVIDGGPLYERRSTGSLDFIYPPLSAILLALPSVFGKIPMYVALCFLNAIAWWTAAQLSQALSGSTRRPSPWLEALPSFALFIFIFDQFDLGQPNLVLLALMLLGFWSMHRGRPVIAGGLFAVATAIKVFPVAVLPYLIWRRRWASVASMLVSLMMLLVVLPAPIRGFERNKSELSVWVTEMVGSNSEAGFGQRIDQNWSWVNQSLIAVTHRLLRPVDYTRYGEHPPQYMNVANLSYSATNIAVLGVATAIGFWFLAVMPSRARMTPRFEADELGILFCLMTVASPLMREYYLIWLMFPITVLTHRAAYDPRPNVRRGTWLALGAAGALMALGIPGLPKLWQALGNHLFATLLLAATLGWHLRNPPAPAMNTSPTDEDFRVV